MHSGPVKFSEKGPVFDDWAGYRDNSLHFVLTLFFLPLLLLPEKVTSPLFPLS